MISAMPRIAIAVADYAAALATFSERFGMPVTDLSDQTVSSLGAHVGMCQPPGGSNIELMAPATPGMALSDALQKFLDRRGDGLYALMLEAPDPDTEAAAIAERGIDVLPLMSGASGRDLHPRSTHGVLIRIYPEDSVGDLGPHGANEPETSGIERVIIATTDAAKAADVYGRGLNLAVTDAVDDATRGVTVATARPNKGGTIEFVSPIDTSKPFAQRIDEHLTGSGNGMFALVVQADSPADAVATLSSNGVDFTDQDGTPEAVVHGARLRLEERVAAS